LTIAFGLRNMADWSAALAEMARVLTPGGHLLVLDFSLPRGRVLRPIYRAYLHHILPQVAGFVTGEKGAYRYLGDSIEKFPSGDEMRALIETSGFRRAQAEPLIRWNRDHLPRGEMMIKPCNRRVNSRAS
jgi:demethylmenaquinone methyltransferase/2-methoxy-6-polyprenyl-1,4-benzoquinol methylase